MAHVSGEDLPARDNYRPKESLPNIDSNQPVDEAKEAAEQYPNPPGKDGFVHLHTHTIFSPLDGVSTPDELFARCAEYGMPAIAITDHGLMAAAPDAYLASKKHNIKYVYGNEIYFADFHQEMRKKEAEGWKASELMVAKSAAIKMKELGALPDYDVKNVDSDIVIHTKNMIQYQQYRRNRHITILAKNQIGYKNLIHMSYDAWNEGNVFYGKPRIWLEQLDKYREGLIVLSGCLNGPISHEIREKGRLKEFASKLEQSNWPIDKVNVVKDLSDAAKMRAIDYLRKFKEIFKDDFYIELQMPGPAVDRQMETFDYLADVVRKSKGKLKGCLTNDAHYIYRKDFNLQKIMMAIAQGVRVDEKDEEGNLKLFHVNSDQQFLKTRPQLRKTFMEGGYNDKTTIEEFEQFCDNTLEVAAKCDTFKPDLSPKLPELPDANNILRNKAYESLKQKNLYDSNKLYEVDGVMVTHKQQCDIELERFIEKGFASYFLITQELVEFSIKKLKMLPGPGRGSCSGSLVCYLLNITSLNPLLWGLSFNRFLSPSRGGHMLKVEM